MGTLDLDLPPGLAPSPFALTFRPPPGLCHPVLEGGDEKLLDKQERSGSEDIDSQCSTADMTTEEVEDMGSLSSQSQTLADVGYSPGRVLRSEARVSARACLLSLENSIEKPQQDGG